MHSLLENYLAEVAAQMQPLPVKRRSEELREIRSHLENAVTVNQEMGQTEAEAATNALEQFGTPQDLGENILWAWRRGEQKRRRRLSWRELSIAAAVCLFEHFQHPHEIGFLLIISVPVLINFIWRRLPPKYQPPWMAFQFSPFSLTQRWPYALAVFTLFVYLHPLYVPALFWTHILTRIVDMTLGFGVFYLRYRESKTALA